MIRPPGVKRPMERAFVVKVAIAAIDRQERRWNRRDVRAGAAAHDLFALTGRNHDHFVAKP